MKRYATIKTLRNTNENVGTLGTVYYRVLTDFGDRLDLLANQFYSDVTLYWIIAAANPNKVNFGSLFLNEGTQLRIPVNISSIIDSYIEINSL